MDFDIEGAETAGYTRREIADYLGTQTDFDVESARKNGYADEEIISHLTQPSPQSGPLTGFAKGLYKGAVYGIPEQLGKAAQFLGVGGETAKKVAKWGEKGIEEGAKEKGVFRQTGEMIPLSAGVPIASHVIGSALMRVPNPYAMAAGLAIKIGGRFITPALFGLAQAQETKETALERGVEPGTTPYVTGGIEWAGETAANIALGRVLGPLAGVGRIGKAAIGKIGVAAALKGTIGGYLKQLALVVMPTEVLTEMGQNYTEALAEKWAGIRPEAEPGKEARAAIAPAALMTAILGPFGRVAQRHVVNKQAEILSQPIDSSDPDFTERVQMRAKVAEGVAEIIPKEDVGLHDQWLQYATDKINANQPIDISASLDSLGMAIDQQMAEMSEESEIIKLPAVEPGELPLTSPATPPIAPGEPGEPPPTLPTPPITPPIPSVAPEEVVPERRKNLIKRKRISELSPEEMREELLTDHLTRLDNKRAYNERERKSIQASLDVDSLKWVNDNFGHEAGNTLLETMGEAIRNSGLMNVYHFSGDEFHVEGDTPEEVNQAIAKARAYLKNTPMTFTDKNNIQYTMTADFSHGVGNTLSEAEANMREDKIIREESGKRVKRGEMPLGVKPLVTEPAPEMPEMPLEPKEPVLPAPVTPAKPEAKPAKLKEVLSLVEEAQKQDLHSIEDITDYVKSKTNPEISYDERRALKTEVYNIIKEQDKGKPSLAEEIRLEAEGKPKLPVTALAKRVIRIPEAPGVAATRAKIAERKAKEVTTPKAQKEYLLDEIQKAMDLAPKEVDIQYRMRPIIGKPDKKRPVVDFTLTPSITVEVPEDGKFTVVNDKKHLLTFLKQVKSKLPVQITKPKTKPSGLPAPTGKRIRGEDIEYYNEFRPRKQDIVINKKARHIYSEGKYTDGMFFVETPKPKGITFKDEKPDFSGMIPSAEYLTPAKIIGEMGLDKEVCAHLISKGKPDVFLDARRVDAILTQHPYAVPFITGDVKRMTPVIFKVKGEVVGGVMPLKFEEGYEPPKWMQERMAELRTEEVKPEEAKFLTVTEGQTLTDINNKKIILTPDEPFYRIERNEDGTVTLIDGKEVTTILKKLKGIKGIFSLEPNPAAGGITGEMRARREKVPPLLSDVMKRTIGTVVPHYTKPSTMPNAALTPMRDFFKAQGPKEFSKWHGLLSVPFRFAQKYPSWAAAWDIHVNRRQENRSVMTSEFFATGDAFLTLQKKWKKEGLTRTQITEGLVKVERVIEASDIILHDRLKALKKRVKEVTGKERIDIQNQINEIGILSRFSDLELKAGITDEYGEKIPPLSDREIAAYVAARNGYNSIWETRIDHTIDMALLRYEKQKWYKILLAASGIRLDAKETQILLNRKGLNKAAIAYAKKIRPDIVGLFERLEQGITEVPAKELANVVAKYEKQTTTLATGLKELQSHIGKMTGISDKLELTKLTRELFSAYLYTRPHLKEINRLRNEMKEWPGYAPRYRDQGKYKVKLIEKFIKEDGSLKINKEGVPLSNREIHMEMANSKREAEEATVKIFDLYAKEGKLPDNYFFEYEAIETTPELAFQGVNDVNIQRIIDDSIKGIELRQTYYNKKGERVDIHDELRDAAFQAIADTFKKRGAMRATIHRNVKYEAIKGYKERGFQQIYINYASSMAGLMTKQRAAADMLEVLSKERDPAMFSAISKWNKEQLRNESEADRWSGWAKTFAFTWMLGGLLRAPIINATQPIIIGIPELKKYMRKHGVKGMAGSIMLASSRDVLFGKTSEIEKRLMDESMRKGIAVDQYIQSIFEGTRSAFGQKFYGTMGFLAKPFSMVEVHNRLSCAVAIFRVAYPSELKKALSRGLTGKEAEEAAYRSTFEIARTFNYNVNYAYGKANRPVVIQSGDLIGVTGSALYTFKAFPHNFMARQAEILSEGDFLTLAHTIAYTALFGGLMGLPFFKDFFNWFEKKFGYSLTKSVRKILRGAGGKTLETLGISGLPGVLGANISGSLNIGLPWPLGADNPEESIFGVVGSLVQRAGAVGRALERGDIERAATEISPEFLRAPQIALRESIIGKKLGYQGFATTPHGRIIYDEKGKPMTLSTKEAFLKMGGITPTEYAHKKEMHATVKRQEAWVAEKKTNIAETLRIARLQHKPDAMKEAMESVRDLNQKIRSRELQGLVPFTSLSRIIRASRQISGIKERRERKYKEAEL